MSAGVIGRVDEGDWRWYVDPKSGARYESVTSILSRTSSKPWLTKWSAKLAAEAAVDHLDLLRQLLDSGEPNARASAIAWLKDAATRRREMKADIGSYCHDVIEALIVDGIIPSPPPHLLSADGTPIVIDDESVDLNLIVDGFTRFCEDYDPEFLMAEATVANPFHGYAGTLDIVARLRRLSGLVVGIDSKTGVVIDEQANPQLAAYRRCTVVWLDDLGNVAPMPAWDRAAILHLRTSYRKGYKLLEQPADEHAFGWFLACREVLRFAEAAPPVKGRPLYPSLPDGSQPPMLVEDVPVIARWADVLADEAAATTVADLASLTVDELLLLRGIGEQSIGVITDALAEKGLRLTGDPVCPGGMDPAGAHKVGRSLFGWCPSCGLEVSTMKTGEVRFHTAPVPAAEVAS